MFTGTDMLSTRGTGVVAGMIAESRRDLVEGLWQDTPPADNDVTLSLAPVAESD